MRAGTLRHSVTIQSPSGEEKDDRGEVVPNYGDVATVWAEVMPLAGAERIQAATISPELTHRVSMRQRSDLTSRERLVWGERIFEIVSVMDVGERGRELRLLCKETL